MHLGRRRCWWAWLPPGSCGLGCSGRCAGEAARCSGRRPCRLGRTAGGRGSTPARPSTGSAATRRRRPPPARRCGARRPRCRRSSRGGPSASQRSPTQRRPGPRPWSLHCPPLRATLVARSFFGVWMPRSTTAMALRLSGRFVRCTASGSSRSSVANSLPRSVVTTKFPSSPVSCGPPSRRSCSVEVPRLPRVKTSITTACSG